ncbi:MAG: hypothetical protein OXE94_01935 [Aestuariivita sp.]|nr:hypothetical protein [Aestuariivita sp.]
MAPGDLRGRDGHAACGQGRDGEILGIDLSIAHAGRLTLAPAGRYRCLRGNRRGYHQRGKRDTCAFSPSSENL